ncbi:MAG TPA: hypothetical protein VMU01_00990 [Rhizomicrobium sp.]|nr:hypothetical protein [Rhizomicrobium sp.]
MGSRQAWLFAAMVAAAFGAANAQTITQESGEDWARIIDPVSKCDLVNNVWDRRKTPEGFEQSIFLENRDGEQLPGWRWNAPGKREIVLGMPEIVCGQKPWDDTQRLHDGFPFHPGIYRRPFVVFDAEIKVAGRYDMAFSLWAVSKLPAVKAYITHEITIWTMNSGMTPQGDKVGTLDTGGTVFDIYLDPHQGVITGPDPFTWTLVTFVARTPLAKGELHFGPFLDDLLARKILPHEAYVTDVELGTEIVDGAGRIVLKDFAVGFPLSVD